MKLIDCSARPEEINTAAETLGQESWLGLIECGAQCAQQELQHQSLMQYSATLELDFSQKPTLKLVTR